jgi:hypothetical protein
VIPGITGHLLSHAYLEQHVLPGLDRSAAAAAFEHAAARWWRVVTRSIGPSAGARQVFDVAASPLLDSLGYSAARVRPVTDMLMGLVSAGGSQAALMIALPWSAGVDVAWRDAIRGGVGADAAWALVTNGRALRILDCRRPWARQALHFDFEPLFANPRGPLLLWVLAGADATLGDAGTAALRARANESDLHAARVCHALGDGVLRALPQLTAALAAGGRGRGRRAGSPYDQALTVVYRVLFLLFAEARGLVPVWHPVYREAYTIDALYRRTLEPRAPRGLWAALQAIARMAHAGCKAGDLDVTAFNGRLFSPRHAPLVEQRRVPEDVVKAVVLALATTDSPAGRRRIAYHDLGVEQLGAVYERVLEHEPVATRAGLVLRRTSTERKATGSFYTPRSITEFLVRRTLHPVVMNRPARDILGLRVVDPAMGSGAFLVAACHYLADQCEQALIRDGEWRADDATPAGRADLRRQVAEQCLYGVDLNPTAVQLARLSLWLTTLASGKPLTFLDHHLAVGNSLLGARLADLVKPPVRQRAAREVPLPLFDDGGCEVVAARVLPERLRLALEPSDTLQAVREKERTLERLSAADGPFANWSRAADAWCAAALWPGPPPSPALVNEWIASRLGRATTLPADQLAHGLTQAADIAASHAVFHWELAFPEVFFDARGHWRPDGGFDAVLGNPPWDMLRADSGPAAGREADRARAAPVRRFFRSSGVYAAQGHGHANRYQLFLERALQLARPGGRVGLILPSGIATDHGSARLRRQLFDRCAIDTWLGLENKAAIFPIHRSVRFTLIAATSGGRTESLRFRSGVHDPRLLDRCPSDPRQDEGDELLSVSRSRLEAWDPEHLTVPELTSPAALAILTAAAVAAPALGAAHGWNARFGRELNATDDRGHFIHRPRPDRRPVMPIIEGKHVAPFSVSPDLATLAVPVEQAGRLIDPAISFERERIAYRDVASATNRLTLIAGLLPRHTLSTHTVFVLKTAFGAGAQWCLLALLNSLVANYLVRLSVTTHVTTALMSRLPVPRPQDGSPAFRELAALARALSTSGIDGDPGSYARLNAIVAGLYGLTPDHYEHVVASFPLISQPLRTACVAAYQQASSSPARTPTP